MSTNPPGNAVAHRPDRVLPGFVHVSLPIFVPTAALIDLTMPVWRASFLSNQMAGFVEGCSDIFSPISLDLSLLTGLHGDPHIAGSSRHVRLSLGRLGHTRDRLAKVLGLSQAIRCNSGRPRIYLCVTSSCPQILRSVPTGCGIIGRHRYFCSTSRSGRP